MTERMPPRRSRSGQSIDDDRQYTQENSAYGRPTTMNQHADPVATDQRQRIMSPVHHLLQSFLHGTHNPPDPLLQDAVVDSAIRRGLGPILYELAAKKLDRPASAAVRDRLLAADLAARATTGAMLDTIREIAALAAETGHRVVLLKGASTALTVYPAPHLRPMGDIDLLVTPEALPQLEAQLRERGYEQESTVPAEMYASHHHAMPFLHRRRGLWLELHTGLVRPALPVARISAFSPRSLFANLVTRPLGDTPLQHLRPELALIHTCVHLVEDIKWDRAVFALLDMALLLRRYGSELDWPLVARWLQGTPALAQVDMLLAYLHGRGLIDVRPTLTGSGYSNADMSDALVRRLLSRLLDDYIVRGRPFSRMCSETNVVLVWRTLLDEGSPRRKLVRLPWNLLFPPANPNRFRPSFLIARIRSALGWGRDP